MNLTTHESNNRRSLNYLWSNSRRQFYNPFDHGSALGNWQEFLLVRSDTPRQELSFILSL